MSAATPRRATGTAAESQPQDLRAHILAVASDLFYKRGVRAVGVDLVVDEAKVAKTSLYRYFPNKDDLIVAFLQREDEDFWALWDSVAARHADDPRGELEAHTRWIGQRLSRSNYRGCPQINVAAEFAEHEHPARGVARSHMHAMRGRLTAITRRMKVAAPDRLAAQLALLINGAFVSSELLTPKEATATLLACVRALCDAAAADSR